MGSNPPELSLDFRPSFVPATIGDLLREVSAIGDARARSSKLDGYVARLQGEMSKIDAFKRELPLCMLLLKDAILALKMESEQCAAPTSAQPVLEEFIPLKKDKDEDDEKLELNKGADDSRDKKNWMSSVQLWNADDSPPAVHSPDLKQELKLETTGNQAQTLSATEDLLETCKGRNGGRPFGQLKGYSPFSAAPVTSVQEEKMRLPIQGLSLLAPGIKNPREKSFCAETRMGCARLIPSPAHNVQSNLPSRGHQPPQQTARKQRRCWSPELHRRFVNALQQLGGSQVATPKQIRELMQVDGLTNDEVKSHLQKYRLHTRRISSATSSPADQSVAILGGLWLSPDQYGDSSKGSSSQSDSPQGPLQLGGSMGATTSTTGGNSMEDEEDERSECYSWKSHVNKPGTVDV
ncbi:transcription factor HRS1-like [Syzygium oleosum]|uniref:transcription factor HRS1-like n=1 Tax=Syzygium oleosum TaxID=219896 RepID=UPI0024B949F7|nr:transcription factor HRS1-like [Syzygium oleosum]